jgi:hypothetical protein
MRRSCFVFAFGLSAFGAGAASLTAFSSVQGSQPPKPWAVAGLPTRYKIPVTQFDLSDLDGVQVLRIKAEKSWGSLVHPLNEAVKPNTVIRWRWRLDQPLPKADIRVKETEDSPLKVCLSFDMPTDNIPSTERALFKLAQLFTREKIPTATLCYVWGNKEAIGYEQASLFTSRVRFIVVANGASPSKTWVSYERNVHADFLAAFGQETQTVPALSAILVGADSDTTQGLGLGYVGDVQLGNASAR